MTIRSLLFLAFTTIAAFASAPVVLGFQQMPPTIHCRTQESSSTAVHGIFDSIKKSMESGYAGGEDSPYTKIKEQDAKREAIRKKRAEERKKRGFTELKDVKNKSFVKLTYKDNDDEDEPKEEKKKLFGLF
mmetsp:Transcript_10249/g.24892  ORF Transcript_10249/g.24892 Transcript_10249/m.24892 type:complete len:131 (+) Transcript_10249:142-534(+)|eukprot:CAMPEP_0197192516 /NCGR_PEP_ID=MMETSP1423-20130617/25193_1 /TAXON_ID=476441 /ORGANISM="Pseudo-nitzschia heimii, Strain UNC1101" /LENGTH=130 /DNA_ID=CAMNT_0042645413 /DNA_START=113 /DNA_END=505 /DNA_ORIENTATION=+